MISSFRARLFLVSVAIVAASLLAVDSYVSPRLERYLVGRIEAELAVRTQLVAGQAALLGAPLDVGESWHAFASERASVAAARVTVIRRDGVVIGDSGVGRAALAEIENHADRPEVKQALGGGGGAFTRLSRTVGERMTYAATPLRRGAEIAGVVRLARPLTEVDAALAQIRGVLVGGSLVALLVALGISWLAAQRLSATVGELTAVADRVARGDLEARSRPRGKDELARLGGSLNSLAESLSRSLSDLRAERDLVHGMFSAMQEGVLLVDGDGRIALLNPALCEMLLLGPDVLGKTVLEAIRRSDLQALIERARQGASPPSEEIDFGGVKPRQLLARALALAEPASVLVVIVDVTRLRRLESVRRDFVANASHELRTPVTALASAAETLRNVVGRGPGVALPFVDIIERNAERLRALIEDLLDLGRIESRELALRREPTAVREVYDSVAALLAPRAEKRRIALAAELPPDIPRLDADRRALEQVLSNLVDNALKYCPEGSRITVRAEPGAGMVRVAVADDGPGIAEEHLPRLFERFYRVDIGRSRELGGTGLGLAIVKHLVEAMGGTVGVESQPGAGSVFSFTLPQAR